MLLNWFERACGEHDADVDVVSLPAAGTPNDIPTRDALIDVLSPPSGLAKLLPRKVGVAAVGSVEWAPPSGGVRNLPARLTARCRRKPLAVLLDEAHTLDRLASWRCKADLGDRRCGAVHCGSELDPLYR